MNDINDPSNPPKFHNEVPIPNSEVDLSLYPVSLRMPPEFQNDYDIRYDKRTDTSEQVSIGMIEAETQKAILIELVNSKTGEIDQRWLPKKVCTNLNETEGTMQVWEVFAKQHLQDYL